MIIRKKRAVIIAFLVLGFFTQGSAFTPSKKYIDPVPTSGGMSPGGFASALTNISVNLEQGRLDEARDLIGYDFMHSATNRSNQILLQKYTSYWVQICGDSFPEAFLIHALAGGDMSLIVEQYDKLSNLVSKNCARWALMVTSTPLNETIQPIQKHYFYCDLGEWRTFPARNYNGKFSHWATFRSRQPVPCLSRCLSEAVIPVREDHVPVPWGNRMKPSVDAMPFLVSKEDLHLNRRGYGRQHLSSDPARRRWYSSEAQGVGLSTVNEIISLTRRNKVWDFFIMNYEPFEFLGGQIIGLHRAPEIRGRFHYFMRVLVSKKMGAESFLEDAKQDILLSPAVGFEIALEGETPRIKFLHSGVSRITPVKDRKSYAKYYQLLGTRFVLKWGFVLVMIISLILSIRFLKRKKGNGKGVSGKGKGCLVLI